MKNKNWLADGTLLIILIVLGFVLIFSATGCTSTKSVVTEYDSMGKITKVTETSESVVKEVTASTKGKTVVAWESGWAAYITASTATASDPTPTVRMFAGKTDRGIVSALPGTRDWAGIAAAINATKYDLTVSSTGVSSAGSPAGSSAK